MSTITITQQAITSLDLSQAWPIFLRLNIADGDASPKTIASYLAEVRQHTQWCEGEGVTRPAPLRMT